MISSSRSQIVCSCQWSDLTRGGALHTLMLQMGRKAVQTWSSQRHGLLENKHTGSTLLNVIFLFEEPFFSSHPSYLSIIQKVVFYDLVIWLSGHRWTMKHTALRCWKWNLLYNISMFHMFDKHIICTHHLCVMITVWDLHPNIWPLLKIIATKCYLRFSK